MVRTSSPGWYSLTSSKFMPWPLKTLWYWPASVSLTSRFVRISIWRIFLRISRGIIGHPSRHRQFIKNLLNNRFAGLFFRFGFVGDGDAVAQHVHADALHVLRGNVAAATKERKSLGSERQRDRSARRRAELDEIFHLDFVGFRFARGAHEVHNVILHFVVHVN